MKVKFNLNGEDVTWDVEPNDVLLDVLRREGFYGAKRGCSTGDCGTCTVLVNGEAVNSCLVFAASVEEQFVTTIEGVGDVRNPHPVQRAYVEAGAVQCGFCTPGLVVSTVALLNEEPDPTEEDVREALDGNLCRCTGYVKVFDAVRAAAQAMRGAKTAAGGR